VFVDGQNLFYAVKRAFGYRHPNYAIATLAETVCREQGWQCTQTSFYTGIPEASDNAFWHRFWVAKLATMGTRGVRVFSRHLRYRNQTVVLPDGGEQTVLVGQEKGIDIRIALDMVHAARSGDYDVLLVFSQDQDLSEVATEVRSIAAERKRWLKMASAFPRSPTYTNKRGVDKTDWIPIQRSLYDQCIDKTDYRRKRGGPQQGKAPRTG